MPYHGPLKTHEYGQNVMKAEYDQFPIFEANQVLSNRHLNQVFNYLDEQNRLTRSNLIGIGIVCGFELEYTTSPEAVIRLSKGVGITSEGYLISQADDIELSAYRSYTLPNDIEYAPFEGYPLWELFPDGEPNTQALNQPSGFLNDKALLLFLELKKAPLRNCSPNNCDDKGSSVTVTLRRLLIKRTDLADIIAALNGLDAGLSSADLENQLAERFNLPDLRLPNISVPSTSLATSQQVLAAFHAVFSSSGLAAKVGEALSAGYRAFKPLVENDYPNDPFEGFDAKFGFLNSQPDSAEQVLFLPYYYDCFDDLLSAYDEFRWQAAELICLCGPPTELFPRHLMLGLLFPEAVAEPGHYRHRFLPSPAVGACTEQTRTLQQLFARLVEMVERFSNKPPLTNDATQQIKITPSRLGAVALSEKAIPYYYLQNGNPPLYRLWNPVMTRRGRDAQNLGYRAFEYASQAFVLDPLRFDLEPYNFLRIEGHLGKPYQDVLENLLLQKERYRLPIQIMALRTGAFEETGTVDLKEHACYFEDLLTLYRAYKREILCASSKALSALLNKNIGRQALSAESRIARLDRQPGTLGALFAEKYRGRDVCDLVDIGEPPLMNAAIRSVGYLHKFEHLLVEDLAEIDWPSLQQNMEGLKQWTAEIEKQREGDETAGELDWKALSLVLKSMLDQCKLEALELIEEELLRRVREVKKKRFLSHFLQKHPGIRHKAGVPIGGTFVLVYHQTSKSEAKSGVSAVKNVAAAASTVEGMQPSVAHTRAKAAADRLKNNPALADDKDLQWLLETVTGRPFRPETAAPSNWQKLLDAVVGQLPDGSVIADFYLPYLCCSDCAPIQFVLPKSPPTFDIEVGCTNPNHQAEVSVIPLSGKAPYRLQLNDQAYVPLTDKPLILNTGAHRIRIIDADDSESIVRDIVIAEPLRLLEPDYQCPDADAYIVTVRITGGTQPYSVNGELLSEDVFVSPPTASGQMLPVEVVDRNQCSVRTELVFVCEAECDLPCEGLSRRCAYRLWLQAPGPETPYEVVRLSGNLIHFRFNGQNFEIGAEKVFADVTAANLNQSFDNTIGGAIKILNASIEEVLVDEFGEAGRGRLIVSYEPDEKEPFSVLRIEHFVCERFSLEWAMSYGQPAPVFDISVRYSNEPLPNGNAFNGVIIRDRRRNTETRIPAFDCSERNQCVDGEFRRLCDGPDIRPTITFESVGTNLMSFSGGVEGRASPPIIAWIWDFPSARTSESLYAGEKVEVGFESLGPSARLTVITANGCHYVTERTLLLR
ncbi:conserved protein of unknown function [Methylotuvimicrobium alcaliphilum 20Z]|uniref:Uncharacterized protein n=2 Tax=Methylotuvimicrobium alcaliphilum TaxID=271065 RepID=G4STA3_META2|nr:conserved protein of unknown function [Methylotuvimicrobium alcaliphilum 20Z]